MSRMLRRTVDRVAADARAASFRTRSIKKEAKLQGLRMVVSMTDLTTLCLLYTSPSPRDLSTSRMPSSA